METDMQSQRMLARFSASLGIIGAVLAMIGNGFHPHLTDPSLEAFLGLVASRADWTLLHLTLIVSIFCILGVLYGVSRSVQHESAGGLAWLGFALAVAGSTMFAVNFALDGMAMKHIADSWVTADSAVQAAMLPSAEVLHQIIFSFYTTWIFLFLSLPFVLYGLALIQSDVYPRWMGWLGLVSGLGSTLLGMMQYVGGETELLTTLFLVFSVSVTFWVLIIAIVMWRRASTSVVAKLANNPVA